MSSSPSPGLGLEGFCIDRVRATAHYVPDPDRLGAVLDNWRGAYDREGRFTGGSGTLRNLRLFVGPDSVTVEGSPAQFVHGANTFPFGPAEVDRFARDLASVLGAPLDAVLGAVTTALDVALNVVVPCPPEVYFPVFVHKPRALRFDMGSTLYFRTGTRVIRIYAKIRHLRRKGLTGHLTEEQRRAYVLRIEVSTRRATDELGGPVTLGDLATEEGWARARSYWRRHYEAIHVADPTLPFERPEDVPELPKAFQRRLAALGVEASGGAPAVLERIERARRVDPERIDAVRAYRLRKTVLDLKRWAMEPPRPGLAAEVERLVARAVRADDEQRAGVPARTRRTVPPLLPLSLQRF